MSDLDARLAAYRERLTKPNARPNTRSNQDTPNTSNTGLRRWLRLPALFAGGAVLVGGLAIASIIAADDPQSQAVVGTPAAPAADAVAPQSQPQSQRGAVGVAIPAAAPLTTWRGWQTRMVQTMLPSVDGAGPARTLPGELSGYAHTPTGALLAAANIVMALYYADAGSDWGSVADTMVIWPDGARMDLSDRRTEAKVPASPVPLTLIGFRYISYTDQQASVRLWWRGQNTLGLITTLVWRAGDWRVAWDENAADIRVLTASDSYIPWTPSS